VVTPGGAAARRVRCALKDRMAIETLVIASSVKVVTPGGAAARRVTCARPGNTTMGAWMIVMCAGGKCAGDAASRVISVTIRMPGWRILINATFAMGIIS